MLFCDPCAATADAEEFENMKHARSKVRLFVRVRPLLPLEKESGYKSCITFSRANSITCRNEREEREKTWEFDKVFKPTSSNEDVFAEIKDLVASVADGYNACIFAYGQTGAGKKFTMRVQSDSDTGIIMRAVRALFAATQQREKQFKSTVSMSVMSIRNGRVHDMMKPARRGAISNLKIKKSPNGNYVKGLTVVEVTSGKEVHDRYRDAIKNFRVACTTRTRISDRTSRHHRVLSLYLTCRDKLSGNTLRGKLHAVILAGSEQVSKRFLTGDGLKEYENAQRSLSALWYVLRAWDNQDRLVPYRYSKLTCALEDSLSGDSEAVVIAHINPVRYCSRIVGDILSRDGGWGRVSFCVVLGIHSVVPHPPEHSRPHSPSTMLTKVSGHLTTCADYTRFMYVHVVVSAG